MKVLILGLGSPFGDDRLGWLAAEALRRSAVLNAVESGRITIATLDRPGAVLLAQWRDADNVIILDAVRSGALPGTRHRLETGDLAVPEHPASSHGFGVALALALSRVLGNSPPRLCLRGIEMDPAWSGGEGVSHAVTWALPVFVQEVEELVLTLLKLDSRQAEQTARA